MVRFEAEMEIIGVNPYVTVVSEHVSQLRPDWRKPMPVMVKINQKPDDWHRINMVPKGDGSYYLYLNEIVRKASGTKVGDIVDVEVRFDESYRGGPAHPLPEYVAAALDSDPIASVNWQALSPSRQKEVLRYLASLKSEDAKLRNLERLMKSLSGKPTHYMGRDWKGGK